MTDTAVRRSRRRLAEAWRRTWFTPVSTTTLGMVRIAYGLVVVAWGLAFLPDARTWLSTSGVRGDAPDVRWRTGLLQLFPSDVAVVTVTVVLVVAAACLAVGYRTRLAAVAVVVCLVSIAYRNPAMLNSGDILLRNIGFFLMLAPAGAALSVDRWRTARERFWQHPARAPWALRLVQIQISVVYVASAWEKARGDTWLEGTAVPMAIRIDDVARFMPPWWAGESFAVGAALTWSTLAIELALGVLIWNRRARPWVIAAGVALHLGIEVTMALGFFSTAIFVGYLAFVPPERMDRVVAWVRRLGTPMALPGGSATASHSENRHRRNGADSRLTG